MPALSRAAFQLIADGIRTSDLPLGFKRRVAERMASNLATTNPRFNRDRFMQAAIGT